MVINTFKSKASNLNYHMYADDTQLYMSVVPSRIKILLTNMERCIEDVRNWMIQNKLKLNEEKTEVLFYNPKSLVLPPVNNYLEINRERVYFTSDAKNLGFFFYCQLSTERHLNNVCKGLFCELRRIGQISRFLNPTSMKTLISSFIFSRIDYCNSLFSGLPMYRLNKLQRLQNHAARLVLHKKKIDNIYIPLLIDLHWLPIIERIFYKVALLAHKCIHDKAPCYLGNLIKVYVPQRNLRSSAKIILEVPFRGTKKFSDRAFSHFGPTVWNSLPESLKCITDEVVFKKRLKTYLIRKCLDSQ